MPRYRLAVLSVAMLLVASVIGCSVVPTPAAPVSRAPATIAATELEAPPGLAMIVWDRDPGHRYFISSLHINWISPIFEPGQYLRYDIFDYRVAANQRRANQFAGHQVIDPRQETAFVTTLFPSEYLFVHNYNKANVLVEVWAGAQSAGTPRIKKEVRAGQVLYGHLASNGEITLSETPRPGFDAASVARLRHFPAQSRIRDYLRARLLQAIHFQATYLNGCIDGNFDLAWTNIRFEGRMTDCAQGHIAGRWRFDDGSELEGETSLQEPGNAALVSGPSASLRTAEGARYIGVPRFRLGPAQGGEHNRRLPAPLAEGVGQVSWPQGRGFVGGFSAGVPHGGGYCFDETGMGRLCVYENGEPAFDASTRDVSGVLTEYPGLPRQAAVDMVRQKMIDALLQERWRHYLDHLTDLQALGVDTGVEALFFGARALNALGYHELAMAQLNAYISLAGSGGASYGQALSMFSELSAASEKARGPRQAFCLLQPDPKPCGCREFATESPAFENAQCRI